MTCAPRIATIVHLVLSTCVGLLALLVTLSAWHFHVVAESTAPDVALRIRMLTIDLLLLTGFVAGLAYGGATCVIHSLTRPLRTLGARMSAAAANESLHRRIALRGPREIVELAEATDRLAAAVGAREGKALHSERLAVLGTLVAGVAHEINNPLTYMRGHQELLLVEVRERIASARDESEREFLDEAVRALESTITGFDRLASLSSSLRVVGRGRTGERAMVDVNELLNGCLVLAHSRFESGLRAETHLAATARISCDPSEISQLFLNLFLNAADAMASGGTLTIDTQDAPGAVVVRVGDTGSGIPDAVRARVFEPFATTKAQGTGLGLAICKRIADAHGGEIAFETSRGGTTFTVRLPTTGLAARAAAAAPAASEASASVTR